MNTKANMDMSMIFANICQSNFTNPIVYREVKKVK